MRTSIAFAAALVLSATATRAPAADDSLLAAARAAQPAVVASLTEMVGLESGSANAGGLESVAQFVQRRLAGVAADVDRLPRGDGRPGVLVKGTLRGTGTRRIMLIAHMDTVYPAGTLAREPIHQDANRLYGPGIADDKGGIALILHALELLKSRGWHDYAVVTVLFNPDEEVGSPGSRDTIAALAEQHDIVLSFEPSGAQGATGRESIVLATSATAIAHLEVEGRAAHAGGAPNAGRNALVELADRIVKTRDVASGLSGVQLNWTKAIAGGVSNQIPEHASATGDVRVWEPDALDRLRTALQAKVDEPPLVSGTRTTVTINEGRPMYTADARARRWAERARDIYAELDGRPLRLAEHTGGSTDAAYAARSGKPIVLEGLGLAGAGFHAQNEYVDVDSIVPRLYLVTRLLEEMGAANP